METEQNEHPQIDGEIWVTEFTQESALIFREQVLERSKKSRDMPILVRINSYGGSVDALANMISTMDEVPNRFITAAQGCAMSAAAVLLSHGDIRFCDRYTRVMVHNLSTIAMGDVFSLESTSNETQRMNRVFLGLLAKNCKISYENLQEKLKNATDSKDLWIDAQGALELGIVDKIGVPDLVPIVQWACDVRPNKERLVLHGESSKKKTSTKKKIKNM